MPVRVGIPQYVSGLSDVVKNPIYSTGVGLLLFGQKQMQNSMPGVNFDNSVKGVWQRMKNWFQGNF